MAKTRSYSIPPYTLLRAGRGESHFLEKEFLGVGQAWLKDYLEWDGSGCSHVRSGLVSILHVNHSPFCIVLLLILLLLQFIFSHLIGVSSKLFFSQPVTFAFCASSWKGEGEWHMALQEY